MIPLGDVIPWRRPPIVTIALLVVTVGLFAFQLSLSEPQRLALLRATALVPGTLRPLTLLTSIFLHANVLDLAASVIGLWIFGSTVEDRLGRVRYLLFFVFCGLASETARVLADAVSYLPVLGAAGATAGVLGGYFALFPRSRVLVLIPAVPTVRIAEVPAAYLLGGWFGLEVIGATLIPGGPAARAVLLLGLAVGFGSGAVAVIALGGPRRRSEYWEKN